MLFETLALFSTFTFQNKNVKNYAPQTSALSEKQGVSTPEIVNKNSVATIQSFRRKQPSADELISGILDGNMTVLSRAITLVESANMEHLAKANTIINYLNFHKCLMF